MCDKKNHAYLCLTAKTPFFIRLRRFLEAYTYKLLLRFYLLGANFIRIPFIGRLIKRLLDWYGKREHGGMVISKEEAYYWIEKAQSILSTICYCRDTLKNCSTSYPCLRLSDTEIFRVADKKYAHFISPEEAKRIIDNSYKDGLIHTLVWCGAAAVYAICNCCRCCCVPYQLWVKYRIESALNKGNKVALLNDNLCKSCNRCRERCPFGAIIKLPNGKLEIKWQSCFGCGLCQEICENQAITLVERGEKTLYI
jgi:Pyruvate/2-oxoacid:ferredoxin oxidoreductase delta subunit